MHYPVPLHKQPIFSDIGLRHSTLGISEELAGRVLSLPFHPYLTDHEINVVTKAVIESVEACIEEVV